MVMKDLELEEKLRLLEKEINILGEDADRAKLDMEEAVDSLRLEMESLKLVMKEVVPDFQDKFESARDIALREIDPQWINKKQS